jgi:hypothetical protein
LPGRPKMEGVTFADLTEAERMLWEASRAAHGLTLGRVDVPAEGLGDAMRPDPSRVIRAEVIAALLLGAVKAEAGWAAAVLHPLGLHKRTSDDSHRCYARMRHRRDSEDYRVFDGGPLN